MKPRILFVTPRIPYPLDNGWNQRMFHTLKILAGMGRVDLVCYGNNQRDPSTMNLEPLRDICESVQMIEPPPERWPHTPRTYRDLFERFVFSRKPFQIAEFPGQRLAESLASSSRNADMIWVNRIYVAEWIGASRDKMIVDLDDLESVKESRRLALQSPRLGHLLLRFDNIKLRFVERSSPDRYARVVVCSEGDRRFFPRRLAEKVLVVRNGVSGHLLNLPRPRGGAPPTIVFVGNMRYGANVDGALWFTREIFPEVAAVVPGVRLYLVGDDRQGRLRSLHNGETVIVTGRVEDVIPHVSRATVSVVPVRWGGGTRIKILESLALGTPVVSTTIGAEGLDVVSGRHLLLADTPGEFGKAVVTLLRDPDSRRAIAEAGRALVADRYSWETIGRELTASLEAWLEERRAREEGTVSAWPLPCKAKAVAEARQQNDTLIRHSNERT